MALHGVANPQQAQKNPGFLSRYMGATSNPLTSPTPTQDQPGILQAAAEALHGNPQPGSLAAGISSIMSKSPMGAPQGFSGSATGPVPSTSFTGGSMPPQEPQESPLMVRGIRPQPQAPMPPQQAPMSPQVAQATQGAPEGPMQGPPGPMQNAPMPPQRPDDMALFQPRTDAPDPHGPIGSTPTMWGANYHGPEASLFNRMGASDSAPKGPGDGLNSFAQSGAMDSFKNPAGPNLMNFLNMFG